jgi:hypothetical protein
MRDQEGVGGEEEEDGILDDDDGGVDLDDWDL